MLRVARPHASSFVTAVPSEEDGKDCLLRPRQYRTAVAYRLGLPVLNNEVPCPLCMQPINIYGDHATCCAKNGDLVTRHNALRNFVHSVASDGLLQPVLEKQGILGPTTGRRPGDVTIPDWKHYNGLAIDVAVTSPLTKTSLRLTDPCEDYSETQKHKKYDASFEGSSYYFCAMVFETLGGVNSQGEQVLRQLFTFAAKQLGREFSSYCSRAWARLSCCLQRSVAQAILNRIDGRGDDAPELPEESFALVREFDPVSEPVSESGREPVSSHVVSRIQPNEGGSPREASGGGSIGSKMERREGGGGIMNTTHIHNLSISRKDLMEVGSGRNQNGRDLTYTIDTPTYSTGSHVCSLPHCVTDVLDVSRPKSRGDLPSLVGVTPVAVLSPSTDGGVDLVACGVGRGSSGARAGLDYYKAAATFKRGSQKPIKDAKKSTRKDAQKKHT